MNIAEKIARKLPEKERIIMGGVVGSYNFGLNDSLSDNDLRYYVMPTLNDLIRQRVTRRLTIIDNADIQVQDIRRTKYFISMGDMNQLSVLFSKEQYINQKYTVLCHMLISKREELAKDNAMHIYGWGRSMFEKKIGQLSYFKPNESVYKKYGYNTKAACQAIYHLKMVMKFLQNLEYGIDAPMAKAIDCSDISDEINKIRNGGYTLKELQKIADNTLADYDGIMAIPPSKGVPGWYLQAIYHAVEDEVTNSSAD